MKISEEVLRALGALITAHRANAASSAAPPNDPFFAFREGFRQRGAAPTKEADYTAVLRAEQTLIEVLNAARGEHHALLRDAIKRVVDMQQLLGDLIADKKVKLTSHRAEVLRAEQSMHELLYSLRGAS